MQRPGNGNVGHGRQKSQGISGSENIPKQARTKRLGLLCCGLQQPLVIWAIESHPIDVPLWPCQLTVISNSSSTKPEDKLKICSVGVPSPQVLGHPGEKFTIVHLTALLGADLLDC